MHIKKLILLFVIVALGFFARAYKLSSSPEALYIDETSIAYNAYSIISTGRDEHGKFMPLFFEAFGEYKLPVYVYLVALVQLFTGPTDISVRIPSLIFGTLTIFVIYLFIIELLADLQIGPLKNLVPILSSFLLAVSPWHFQFSRPGFEASVGLFFLILGLFLFFKGINTTSSKFVSLALVGFVCSLYSYNSARVVIPLLIILLILMYFKHFNFSSWIRIIAPALVIAIPFLIFSLSGEGLARARQVSVFFQKDTSSLDVISNYLKNITPIYLFKVGDPTFNHLTVHRMSLIHTVEAPFFFMGLTFLIMARSKKLFFIVLVFLISLIPPAIATLNPHALRGMLVLSASPIITAIGFSIFLNFFKNNYLQLLATLFFIFAIFVSTLFFLNVYHNKYIPDSGWDWQVGIKRVSLNVLALEENWQDIYMDVDLRAVPVLWYLKIEPGLYQRSVNKSHLGKYHINEPISSDHGLYVGLKPPEGRLLEYVYYPNNSIAYGIWEF